MENNIGKIDKTIRVLTGIIIIITGAQLESVWGALGVIPIITSQVGVCPLYVVFKINTIPTQRVKNRRGL